MTSSPRRRPSNRAKSLAPCFESPRERGRQFVCIAREPAPQEWVVAGWSCMGMKNAVGLELCFFQDNVYVRQPPHPIIAFRASHGPCGQHAFICSQQAIVERCIYLIRDGKPRGSDVVRPI